MHLHFLPLEAHTELASSRWSCGVEIAVIYIEGDAVAGVVILIHLAPQ